MLRLLLTLFLFQEDPGPPVLKRGPNPPRKKAEDKPASPLPIPADRLPAPETAKLQPGAAVFLNSGRPPLLVRAADVAAEFDTALPNFLCDQIVDRFESKAKPPKWKKEDRVEVELMYIDGAEEYRNFRINGKPLKTETPEDSGSWSRGDWGTTLREILNGTNGVEFTPRPEGKNRDVIAGVAVEVYDLKVKKENSQWNIKNSKAVKPAYTGSIWVDPVSANVLRLEKQARDFPADFEIDLAEMTVEFGWVSIGGQKYLMPVESSNLACLRYTNRCTRNDLKFTNYRKFSTESSISTTESEIKFGDSKLPAEPSKPKPGQKKPGQKKP
jgi:hypothetical protein